MFNLDEITSIILSAITAFIVVYISVPSIVRVSKTKHLYDVPEERSAHSYNIPTLGGLAIFAGLIISISLWIDTQVLIEFQFISTKTYLLLSINLDKLRCPSRKTGTLTIAIVGRNLLTPGVKRLGLI